MSTGDQFNFFRCCSHDKKRNILPLILVDYAVSIGQEIEMSIEVSLIEGIHAIYSRDEASNEFHRAADAGTFGSG